MREYAQRVADQHFVRGLATLPDETVVFSAYRNGSYELCTPDEQLTKTDTDLTRPCWWPGREAILAQEDTGGSELYDIVEVDPDTGAVTPVVEHDSLNRFPRPNPSDPTQIAFISSRDGSLDLYTQGTESGDVTKRSTAEEVVAGYVWSPAGDALAYETGMYGDTHLRLVDLEEETDDTFIREPESEQRITEYTGRGVKLPETWSDEGLLFTTNHETGYHEIALADSSGDYELLHATEHDKFCPQWTTNDDIVFTRPNQGNNEICRLSDGVAEVVESEYDNRYPTPTHGTVVYVQERPDTAGDIMRDSSRIAAEGGVDVPTVEPEKVRYESVDGQEVYARLYTPHSDPVGAVVFIHGGPMSQHWNRLDPHTQTLVRAGFEVLAPDYRGSIGYGRAYRVAQDGDIGNHDLADVVSGARYLREERGHASVGAYGGSFGGYLTLMAVGTSDEFDMGCDICGIVNWKTLYENSRGYAVQAILSFLGGSPEELPEFYEERSPISYVDEINVPLVVVQGENDPRVPVEEAKQIVGALSERGVPHEYFCYEDEGHIITNPDNRVDYLVGAVSLFESIVEE